jgi:hypothetical protein
MDAVFYLSLLGSANRLAVGNIGCLSGYGSGQTGRGCGGDVYGLNGRSTVVRDKTGATDNGDIIIIYQRHYYQRDASAFRVLRILRIRVNLRSTYLRSTYLRNKYIIK